ncbi:MAG: hypothetical protein SGARI_007719 [Bacillariaceae sp.]
MCLLDMFATVTQGFVMPRISAHHSSFVLHAETTSSESASSPDDDADNDDIVARKIIVEGDVQGGYYRSCVLNEAGRFRRLTGTMSPPDDSSTTAEIYVEQ